VNGPERRYRMWLRVYPEAYRTVRGEEILSTLLDSSEHGRPATRDLLYLVAHGLRVRIGLIGKGPVKPPLPQPVRLVTWILVGCAAGTWLNAILDHGYPKHAGIGPGPVVSGFILLGLNLLLQARRRMLYMLVIGAFALFITSILVQARPIYGGLALSGPYLVLTLLLLVGWKRAMADVAARQRSSQQSVPLIPTED
jgi:hypothetical protein